MNYILTTPPKVFESIKAGLKKAVFRLINRNFKPGDTLILQEYEPLTKIYTGDEVTVAITHIQTGFGIPHGYCMMSFDIVLP